MDVTEGSMRFAPIETPNPPLRRPLRIGLSKQWDRFLSIPSELAIRAMHLPWVDQSRMREVEGGKRALCASGSSLDEPGRAIVDALFRDGVCVTSLASLGLPGTGAMLDEACRLSSVLTSRACLPEAAGKPSVAASASEMLSETTISRWALDGRLLDIVEAYLGEPAAFNGSVLYHSKADGREVGVRMWHRDREDDRMLKVAIYLNDVDEDGGPFQVLTPELQGLVDERAYWRYAKFRPNKQAIKIRDSDWRTGVRTVTGLRGTVILVDPARNHHRGQPPMARDRSAIFHTYFTRRPRYPFFCQKRFTRSQLLDFAASLPERQRACVLWRENLPWRQRLIPPSRLTF
jgi:hypothetical protein